MGFDELVKVEMDHWRQLGSPLYTTVASGTSVMCSTEVGGARKVLQCRYLHSVVLATLEQDLEAGISPVKYLVYLLQQGGNSVAEGTQSTHKYLSR